MIYFLLGLAGALVGGLCLSLTNVVIYHFEKKRVQRETNEIVNKFKQLSQDRLIDNSRNLVNNDSRFN